MRRVHALGCFVVPSGTSHRPARALPPILLLTVGGLLVASTLTVRSLTSALALLAWLLAFRSGALALPALLPLTFLSLPLLLASTILALALLVASALAPALLAASLAIASLGILALLARRRGIATLLHVGHPAALGDLLLAKLLRRGPRTLSLARLPLLTALARALLALIAASGAALGLPGAVSL